MNWLSFLIEFASGSGCFHHATHSGSIPELTFSLLGICVIMAPSVIFVTDTVNLERRAKMKAYLEVLDE